MGDDMFVCIASCNSVNSSGALVGNDSYDLECITQCSQRQAILYQHATEKYTQILQIIAVVLITFGLIGKVFNCIIFLRKPLRGTSTGLLLLLKTIFDSVPLLWTFIFDTKFFVTDEQINRSRLICVLSRSSDIFVSWSIGFVILACTVRLITIIHSTRLPLPTRLRVFILILLMMFCGLIYNWHVFYYPNLVKTIDAENENTTFTYCNIIFGGQMGYFSFGGFQSTQELPYNAPIVNFIVSSLIPFAIVASTNIVIIKRVLKSPSSARVSKVDLRSNGVCSGKDLSSLSTLSPNFRRSDPLRASLRNIAHITKKDVSYETTITLTTSCVFLTTNSIASIYVYVKASRRSDRTRLTEDVKTSNVYLILRMLTLIDTVLEFYIYFLTGKKFRQEVYHVIGEVLQHTPLRDYFKFTRSSSTNITAVERRRTTPNREHREKQKYESVRQNQTLGHQNRKKDGLNNLSSTHSTTTMSGGSHVDTPSIPMDTRWCQSEETLERIESTV